MNIRKLIILSLALLLTLSTQFCFYQNRALASTYETNKFKKTNIDNHDSIFPFAIHQDHLTNITDFSSLNKPIRSEDRVIVSRGKFWSAGFDKVHGTDDDQRVKFFGVNLAFGANFPEPKDAPRIAKRLAKLGFNAVRLHHLDTRLSRGQSIKNLEGILTDGTFPTFNNEAVSRLAIFISELKKNGIYISLNLHVGYQFRPDIDGVPPPLGAAPRYSKPILALHPRMLTLQKEYASEIIKRLGLIDNPSLAMVEISNESSLVNSHAIDGLASISGAYLTLLNSSLRSINPSILGIHDYKQRAVLEALIQIDKTFFDSMRLHIKNIVKWDVAVSGTQLEFGGLSNIDSHQNMDFLDSHAYVDHFLFDSKAPPEQLWRLYDKPIADKFISHISARAFLRQKNKPFIITEFNQPWPNSFGAEVLPFFAVLASVQDWDGLFFFAYDHSNNWNRLVPSGFNLNGDSGKLSVTGASAALFRNNLISSSDIPINFTFDRDFRIDASFRRTSAWKFDSFLVSRFPNIDPLIPLVRRVFSTIEDKTDVRTPPKKTTLSTNSGHIRYLRDKLRLEVDSTKIALLLGQVGNNERASAGNLIVEGQGNHIVAMLVTRDNKPLTISNSMLLTIPSPVLDIEPTTGHPRHLEYVDGDLKSFRSNVNPNLSTSFVGTHGPAYMRKFMGRIGLRNRNCAFKAYTLNGLSQRMQSLLITKDTVDSDLCWLEYSSIGNIQSPWIELELNNRPH